MNETFTKLIRTQEEWYPCVDGNKYKLGIHVNYDYLYIKMYAVGDDDFGYEMQYNCTSVEECRYMFDEWKRMYYDCIQDYFSQEHLEYLGFTRM